MTTTEKLVVINQIWDDLLRNPDEIPSPEWHGDVLSARAERIKKKVMLILKTWNL